MRKPNNTKRRKDIITVFDDYLMDFIIILSVITALVILGLITLFYAFWSSSFEKIIGETITKLFGVSIILILAILEILFLQRFSDWVKRNSQIRRYILIGIQRRLTQSFSATKWRENRLLKRRRRELVNQQRLRRLKAWSSKRDYQENLFPKPVSLFNDDAIPTPNYNAVLDRTKTIEGKTVIDTTQK